MKVSLSAPLREQLLTYVTKYGETTVLIVFCVSRPILHKVLAGLNVTPYTLSPFLERLADPELVEARCQLHLKRSLSAEEIAQLADLRYTEGYGRLAEALRISPITLNHLIDGTRQCRAGVHESVIDKLPYISQTLESIPRPRMGRPKRR